MRFQIYQTLENITLKQYRCLKVLNDIYVPYISDMQDLNNQIYILDYNIKDSLKKIQDLKLNISLSPKRVEHTTGEVVNCFLDEDEAKKFINKINETRVFRVGEFVTVREYHELPFEITNIFNNVLQLEHSANSLKLELQIKNDRCTIVEETPLLYQSTQHKTPIKTIYIDSDVIPDTHGLLQDIITIKNIYKAYKIYVINPFVKQKELCNKLGLSVVYGNKYKIVKNILFKKEDLIYTEDLNFLRFVDNILLRVKHLNIYIPEIITKEMFKTFIFSGESDKTFLEGLAPKYYIKDTLYEKLDYKDIKDFLVEQDILTLIEDLPFYLRLIKR